MSSVFKIGTCAAALALASTSAFAGNVLVTKANGDFISGTGIPSDNFTTATNNGVSVALKARSRDTGQALAQKGNRYLVAEGAALSNPNYSWWSFDFQLTPGDGQTIESHNYCMTLEFDTDGSAGTSFITISDTMDAHGILNLAGWSGLIYGDGYFENPGAGAWTSDSTEYVYSQSWRSDMFFLAGEILDAGEYTIRLTVADSQGVVVSTEIIVQVGGTLVPMPSAVGLGGAGLAAMFGVSRRRRTVG